MIAFPVFKDSLTNLSRRRKQAQKELTWCQSFQTNLQKQKTGHLLQEEIIQPSLTSCLLTTCDFSFSPIHNKALKGWLTRADRVAERLFHFLEPVLCGWGGRTGKRFKATETRMGTKTRENMEPSLVLQSGSTHWVSSQGEVPQDSLIRPAMRRSGAWSTVSGILTWPKWIRNGGHYLCSVWAHAAMRQMILCSPAELLMNPIGHCRQDEHN